MNVLLVCYNWKEFIDYQFYELPKGQKWIKQKLISNFLKEDYVPREERLIFSNEIIAIEADEDNLCVLTSTSNSNVFLSYFDITALDTPIWSLNINDLNIKSSDNNSAKLEILLNKQRVFVYTLRNPDLHVVYIIDRSHGELLCEIEPRTDFHLVGVRQFENRILAIASYEILELYAIDDIQNINVIFKYYTYDIFQQRHDIYDVVGIMSDGDKLVSRISTPGNEYDQFTAYDFNTGKKLHTIQNVGSNIISMEVHWPLVLITTVHFDGTKINKNLKIFNMEYETVIKCIEFPDMCIKGIISGIVIFENDRESVLKFWSLEEIINNSIPVKEMETRKLRLPNVLNEGLSNCGRFAISPSCVFSSACNEQFDNVILVKNCFWP